MSDKAGKDNNPNASGPGDDSSEGGLVPAMDESSEGGLVPAILAGAGILAVVGLLVFWPSGDDDAKSSKKKDGAVADGRGKGSRTNGGKKTPDAVGAGGVAARAVDDATPRNSASGKINARMLPKSVGMAPGLPEEEPPPKFKNVEDEIAWYETKLDTASSHVEARQKNAARLVKMKEKAEDSPDPGPAMARYEKSKKIVEGNLTKAEAKVATIEAKLAELRGE